MTKESQWDQLGSYLTRIEKAGLKNLSHHELLEFGRLYRRAASDLSFAQTHGLDADVKRYLNNLIGRAYGHIYFADSKRSFIQRIRGFFGAEFPAAVRREWPFVALSVMAFTFASIIAFWSVRNDPIYAEAIVPPQFLAMIERVVERHEAGGDWMPGVIRPLTSSQIMTNNIAVAFITFAMGLLAGLGTLYHLINNGLMLGAICAGISRADLATISNFYGFILPHGVIEIPAILLAGAAGLILGYSIINPGDYSRATALKLAGKRAFKIVLGVIAMLVVAGIIEAFYSPTLTPDLYKFIFAGITFGALVLYLFVMPLPPQKESAHQQVREKVSSKSTVSPLA